MLPTHYLNPIQIACGVSVLVGAFLLLLVD